MVEVTISPVYNPVRKHNLKKGAISATAVFIVVSVAITGLATEVSINTLVSGFTESNKQGSINWFSTNIGDGAKELCNSGKEDNVLPIDSSYTREIADLEGIEVDRETEIGLDSTIYKEFFLLDFGDDEEKVIFDKHEVVIGIPSYACDDYVEFNGTGSGSSVNLQNQQTYDYRLFSSSKGEVTVEITEAE